MVRFLKYLAPVLRSRATAEDGGGPLSFMGFCGIGQHQMLNPFLHLGQGISSFATGHRPQAIGQRGAF